VMIPEMSFNSLNPLRIWPLVSDPNPGTTHIGKISNGAPERGQ
jgi:hypothetical protein